MPVLVPMKNWRHFHRLNEIVVSMTFSLLQEIVFLDYGLWRSSEVSDFSTRVLWILSHQEVHCQTNHSSAFPVVTFWYDSLNYSCTDEFFSNAWSEIKFMIPQWATHQSYFLKGLTPEDDNTWSLFTSKRCPRLLFLHPLIFRIFILISVVIHSFRHKNTTH